MIKKFGIYMAQLNPTVGDISGNLKLIRDIRKRAIDKEADLIVTPELFVSGYPPEDLILRPSFLYNLKNEVLRFVEETKDNGPAVSLGVPWYQNGKTYNSCLIIENGNILKVINKIDLPNYGVFDEKRVFHPGKFEFPTNVKGLNCGFIICEDMWTPKASMHYADNGAEIIIVINGSPFDINKLLEREYLAKSRVKETGLPLVYVNQVGGQDELIFDGGSFVINLTSLGNKDSKKFIQLPRWQSFEEVSWWNLNKTGNLESKIGKMVKENSLIEDIYSGLVMGLHDYVSKNNFPGVIIGMSGGIDSALTAAIAVDALGPDRVTCVIMPSEFTSKESIADASECVELIGAKYEQISIESVVESINKSLEPMFEGLEFNETEENIQARARGIILMALSNKFGKMVLTTGNKSEVSVGYATLYGDMCGGFSVLKDIYKTMVFELAVWRNKNFPFNSLGKDGKVIPENIITKPPSAELRPDQIDQDNLPPYEILDRILESLVEKEESKSDIILNGFDQNLVTRVSTLLKNAEYKRRQSPPGVKISSRSFGRERRYPITNRYFEN